MLNRFIAVFKNPLTESQVGVLKSICEELGPVFPSVFDVVFDGSFSLFRHMVNSSFKDSDYYLIVPRKMLLHKNRNDVESVSDS